jgi:hypothetical protein
VRIFFGSVDMTVTVVRRHLSKSLGCKMRKAPEMRMAQRRGKLSDLRARSCVAGISHQIECL